MIVIIKGCIASKLDHLAANITNADLHDRIEIVPYGDRVLIREWSRDILAVNKEEIVKVLRLLD